MLVGSATPSHEDPGKGKNTQEGKEASCSVGERTSVRFRADVQDMNRPE